MASTTSSSNNVKPRSLRSRPRAPGSFLGVLIRRVPAGYGKVSVLEELEARLGTPPDRTIYVGDGSSDVHVMLHVNNRDGFTIAVSENKHLARIAKRTVLSDNAFSIVLPMLQHISGWQTPEIRRLFETYGLTLHEWDKAQLAHAMRKAEGFYDTTRASASIDRSMA